MGDSSVSSLRGTCMLVIQGSYKGAGFEKIPKGRLNTKPSRANT